MLGHEIKFRNGEKDFQYQLTKGLWSWRYVTWSYVLTLLYLVLSLRYHTIPHRTVPYHTIPYHTIPYHTIPYHTIPYHTIPYHTTPYHTIPYHTIGNSYKKINTVERRTSSDFKNPRSSLKNTRLRLVFSTPLGVILCHTMPCHVISYTTPYYTIPYHTSQYVCHVNFGQTPNLTVLSTSK